MLRSPFLNAVAEDWSPSRPELVIGFPTFAGQPLEPAVNTVGSWPEPARPY